LFVLRTPRQRSRRCPQVPLSGAVREVGFGVHVITVMGACFLAGLFVGKRLFSEPGAQFAVGAVGMLISLLVETALFVIRDAS
jgi:hypothetical protein